MRINTEHVLKHIAALGHDGCGVTELRILGERPLLAHADTPENIVHLVEQAAEQALGVYVGVQPRPLHLFDKAPNRWEVALSGEDSNCACDKDIEFITAAFWDIDVYSKERKEGFPASDIELKNSLQTAQLLSEKNNLQEHAAICCSGNGHYVLSPIFPIPVETRKIASQFKKFCQEAAAPAAKQLPGIKMDAVYNLSRIMRLMGTLNCKGTATVDRPHRQAQFIIEPKTTRSFTLYQVILNIAVPDTLPAASTPAQRICCNLEKIDRCEFIAWCRRQPLDVTEPLWFALITNLVHLENGDKLAHEISAVDLFRYNYNQTQTLIERILARGYNPTSCEKLKNIGFLCPRLGLCKVKSPMYMTTLFSVWKK